MGVVSCKYFKSNSDLNLIYVRSVCGSRAVKQMVCGEVSFKLILLRLVKTIYTPYTVILAYHTIQHVEHCQLATLGGGGRGRVVTGIMRLCHMQVVN